MGNLESLVLSAKVISETGAVGSREEGGGLLDRIIPPGPRILLYLLKRHGASPAPQLALLDSTDFAKWWV